MLTALAVLLMRATPVANDDVCVYFTYARRLVRGAPFAYDPRGIPSEGFTGPLYLFLLLPFELLGVSPHSAAMLLSTAATCGAVAAATVFAAQAQLVRRAWLPAFAAVLSVLLANHGDVAEYIGWGMETTLNACVVLAMLAATAWTLAPRSDAPWPRRTWLPFALAFAAMLVRPENLSLVAVVFALHWWRGVPLRRLVGPALGFTAALGAYLAIKLLIFGDVFPTGYYRKVPGNAAWAGAGYVRDAVRSYAPHLWLLALALPLTALHRRDRHAIAMLGGVLGCILLVTLVFARVVPLVGFAHRFLVAPIFLVLALLALAATARLEELAALGATWPRRARKLATWLAALLLVAGCYRFGLRRALRHPDRLDIAARARTAFEEHAYVQFGTHLARTLRAPERATMVFGDTGCIPYASGTRFLDTNGLTEPYLARLFRETDPDRLISRFSDHVLSARPDIVALEVQGGKQRGRVTGGVLRLPASQNVHSPLGRLPSDLPFKRRLAAAGVHYFCTLKMSVYDIHLGVRPGSPAFADATAALRSFCSGPGGYFVDGDLVVHDASGEVRFPRLRPDATLPR